MQIDAELGRIQFARKRITPCIMINPETAMDGLFSPS